MPHTGLFSNVVHIMQLIATSKSVLGFHYESNPAVCFLTQLVLSDLKPTLILSHCNMLLTSKDLPFCQLLTMTPGL